MDIPVIHGITESSEMYGNMRSIVNKTRNIRILLTNHRLITEMGQCGPTEESENSGYSHAMLTKHGTVGDVPDNYFYGNERK